MASNLEFVRTEMNGKTIREAAEGMGAAVVLTDTEIVLGRAGLIGRWGSKLQRFDLSRLVGVSEVPYPTAHLLSLEFAGAAQRSVTITYDVGARGEFERIIAALQERAASNVPSGSAQSQGG